VVLVSRLLYVVLVGLLAVRLPLRLFLLLVPLLRRLHL
jgi:hypothetical protein